MPVQLAQPLFLLILPLVAVGLWYTRQRVLSLWGWRRDISAGLRFCSAVGFAVALAGPSLRVADDSASVVVAVDESASLAPAATQAAQAWLTHAVQTQRPADRLGVVAFAGLAQVVQPLTANSPVPHLPDPATLQPGSTDIAQALRLSASLVRGHSNPRIVLLSDGASSAGDIDSALHDAGDVAVDVVPLGAPPDGPEVQIESLQGPEYVRAGESFDATATIDSTEATSVNLQVAVDGQVASQQDVQLNVGRNEVTISPTMSAEGFHPIAVRVLPTDDTDPNNNVAFSYVVVKPKPRVLVVDDQDQPSTIEGILKNAQMQVDLRTSDAMPSLPRLNDYAAVVLDNVSATSLSLDQQKTLQTYVGTNGHGLVTLGGLTSYAPGGYSQSALEDVLPVLSKPPDKREGAQLAFVLVVDRSASMGLDNGGVTRMGMAKEAAVLTANNLKPDDILGVLAFDKQSYWIIPPDTLQNIGVSTVGDRIASLTAEGGTGLYQALKQATDVLNGVQADLKEMVIVDDGQADDVNYDDVMTTMRQDKIGLSVVAMGDDVDTTLMQRLARLGQGRYYATAQLRDIPRVITQEAALAKRAAVVQGTITPQFVTVSPILRGIAPNQIPQLAGHIATTAKDTGEVILNSDEGAPLLAQWHYGLGRSVAWTSDVDGPWTPEWKAWNQNNQFWEQAVRWAMGPPVNRDFRVDVTRTGNQANVDVEDISDGKLADLQALTLKVVAPGGTSSQVPLRQTASGRYAATVVADTPGAYEVDVAEPPPAPGTAAARTESNGFAVPPVAETTSFVANAQGLRRIASETGGTYLDPQHPGNLYSGVRTSDAVRWDPIWAAFAVLALGAFVLDVAVRRLRPSTLRTLFGRPAASKG